METILKELKIIAKNKAIPNRSVLANNAIKYFNNLDKLSELETPHNRSYHYMVWCLIHSRVLNLKLNKQ